MATCPACNRAFVSEEALNQHSNTKHGTAAVVRETPGKSNNMKYAYAVIPLSIILAIIALNLASGQATGNTVAVEGEPFKGEENAPVVIEAFEDPQCPFCQRFTTAILPEIQKNYIDTGKVKYVFRQFPVPSAHPWAMTASIALECAFLQDSESFWNLHDYYYQNQLTFSTGNINQLTTTFMRSQSVSLEEFTACLNNQQTRGEVNQDYNDGIAKGVRGTPSFLVNGRLIVGAQPFHVWASMIDQELAKAGLA